MDNNSPRIFNKKLSIKIPTSQNSSTTSSSSLLLKLTAGSIISHYRNSPSPTLNVSKEIQKISERPQQVYSDWEIFSASKESKPKINIYDIKQVRSSFKNPYIFSNDTDTDIYQQTIEDRLLKALKNILKD